MPVNSHVIQNGEAHACDLSYVIIDGEPVGISDVVPKPAGSILPPQENKFPVISAVPVGQQIMAFDTRLADRIGTTTPLLAGPHGYSGNSFPSTFASSSVYYGYTNGYSHSVLNVKCDWAGLANGTFDSRINGFIDSIPAGHTCYLIINHEPENDGTPSASQKAAWRNGQARAANIIAARNDPRCEFAVCLMGWTWQPASGRNPNDWNPNDAPNVTMTQAALDRTIFAPDDYTKILNSSGTSYQTMASRFDPIWEDASSWGFKRFAISEHSLNNDINAPVSSVVSIWENDHLPYLRSLTGLVYYAYYNTTGPASGTNSMIDTPQEETMFGNLCKEQNR